MISEPASPVLGGSSRNGSRYCYYITLLGDRPRVQVVMQAHDAKLAPDMCRQVNALGLVPRHHPSIVPGLISHWQGIMRG